MTKEKERKCLRTKGAGHCVVNLLTFGYRIKPCSAEIMAMSWRDNESSIDLWHHPWLSEGANT